MLPFAFAIVSFIGVALNLFGATLFPVLLPVKPVGRQLIASSAAWIQHQSRLLVSYTKRRLVRPTSSLSGPLVTPSLRRASPTRPRPPAPTLATRIVARLKVKVLDLAVQCQPRVAQLQHPVCTAWDEHDVVNRPLPYSGPTSLSLGIVPTTPLYSVLLPLSTFETLPRLTLDAGSLIRDDACIFVFSWLGVFVSFVTVLCVLFALHKIFPSKSQRSRLTAAKSAKRKATIVASTAIVAQSWFPVPAQPVLEPSEWWTASSSTQVVCEFNKEVPAEMTIDVVEAAATVLGDAPLPSEGHSKINSKPKRKRASKKKRKATVVEAVQTNTEVNAAKAAVADERPPSQSRTEVKPKPWKASKHALRKWRAALKAVDSSKASVRSPAPHSALYEGSTKPWSEHKPPPTLKPGDIAVQQRNEKLNQATVLQQVGPWKVPKRPDGSATRIYRLPKAFPPLSEVTPSNKPARCLRILGPKRDRYVPSATRVGGPDGWLVDPSAKKPVPAPKHQTSSPPPPKPDAKDAKGKGKAQANGSAERPQDDLKFWEGTVQGLILAAIENASTAPRAPRAHTGRGRN